MKLNKNKIRKMIQQSLKESKALFPFPSKKHPQGKETRNKVLFPFPKKEIPTPQGFETKNKVRFPFDQDPDNHGTIADMSDRELNLRGYNDGLIGNMAAHYGNDAYMSGYHAGQEDAYEDQDTEDYE